ncbi:MaoC/PaaZ C-terminal domain-containing protein [Bradyrhizobium sp. B024]|uniref:MaoC/PaaZ C-terminal domain-containing protein n=1 Tax=Bradyrhizobium sp. B024 TaxID=3140247 RepID=UPI0030B83893
MLKTPKLAIAGKAGPYFVSKDEIIQFAKQYDARPFHIDEEAAAHSVFAGLTASGAHTFAIFISLTSKLQPPLRVLAGLGWDEVRLPNAVPPETTSILNRLFWRSASRGRAPIGESFATKSTCATKDARRCCSASAMFSLRGDRMRKHRCKPFNKLPSVGFALMSLVRHKATFRVRGVSALP